MRLAIVLSLFPLAAVAQPWRAPFTSETAFIPGNQAGDTAILPDRFGLDRAYVFGSDSVNNGLYAFFLDGGTGVSLPVGAVGGIDAIGSLAGLPTHARGGLVAVSATTAGSIVFFTSHPDGGMSAFVPSFPVLTPRAVALGDFADAGARLFFGTGNSQLNHARLEEDGGTIVVVPEAPVALPFFPRALAVDQRRRLVYASTSIGGIYEVDVLSTPVRATQVIDAGTPLDIAGGLAVYAQHDGGALLVATLPAQDRLRVFRVAPTPVEPLGDFEVAGVDGGRLIRGAEFVELTAAPLGGAPDASTFPNGALVICDRNSIAGANYKLVRWEDFANASMPPLPIDPPREEVLTPGPVTVKVALSVPVGAPVELSWWPSRDVLLTTTDGVTARSPADAGVLGSFGLDGGLARGVDAVDPLEQVLTDGLAVATVTTADGGLVFLAPLADGGQGLVLATSAPPSTAITLADFGDAGVQLFAATNAGPLARWALTMTDAGVLVSTRGADVPLPSAALTLAAHPRTSTLYFTTRAGVFRVSPFAASPQPEALLDAGSAALTLYPQADGGALVVVAAPAIDRLLVFGTGAPLDRLAELRLSSADGGTLFSAPLRLDVSALPMGRFDGGATWPDGVLALATTDADAGVLSLVSWGDLARAATPPLPIDAPGATQPVGGGSAGGAGGGAPKAGGSTSSGGGRAGGAGGGGIEEPPMGCCNGGPADAVIPALAFVLWLRSFRRRTMRGS